MTRIRVAAFAAALTVLAAGCGGTHPKPVYAYDHAVSFVGMGTYAWYADPKFVMPHGDSVIDSAFLDSHIRSAIEDALHKKGYLKVDAARATLLVAYYTSDTGVGEHDEYGNYEWATGYVVATNWEKERTVRIDFRNNARKLIWRGSIDRLEGSNPDKVARELDREVDTLLQHFPPTS